MDTNGSFAQITFGIPFPNTNDASRAVDCALAVQKGLVELNKKTEDVGLPTIHISIGLSSGIGLCGAVGPSKMKKYTVMGSKFLPLFYQLLNRISFPKTLLMIHWTCNG